MIAAVLLAALLLQLQPAEDRDDAAAVQAMNNARASFEYGDYKAAGKSLAALIEVGRFDSASLRAEAYRLLGLSLFYQGRKGEAYPAFLEYLYLDPDAELDPFYFPPAGVSGAFASRNWYIASIRGRLAPLRAQKREELEAKKRLAAEEEGRRRQHELEEERKRLQTLQPSIERRVVQKEFWVSVMPFGLGQLQNGERSLGIALATAQVVTGAASGGSALLLEQLRDSATGKFDDRGKGSPYALAQRLVVVKWVSAGLFYALWAAGAIQASIHFQPEQQLPDRLVTSPEPEKKP